MSEKKYKSISEVSKLLNINTHVIRYWDAKFEGVSTRINNKQRFFNKENIQKLIQIKDTIYKDGKHNYSLDLANRLINNKNSNKEIEPINFDEKKQTIDINMLIDIRDNLAKLCD